MGSIEQVWEPQLGLVSSTALKAFDIFGLGIQIEIQCLKINPVPDHCIEPILISQVSFNCCKDEYTGCVTLTGYLL